MPKDQQIEELLDVIEDLLDTLEGVITQSCWSNEDMRYDSMCISSYAEAMRLLGEWGRLEILSEGGRRVVAVDKDEDLRPIKK